MHGRYLAEEIKLHCPLALTTGYRERLVVVGTMRDCSGPVPQSYWDAMAAQWDSVLEDPRQPNFYHYRTVDLYIEEAAAEKQRVLELGCGTGSATELLLKHHENVVGIDFSKPMVRVSRKRVARGRFRRGVDLALCDAQMLPFTDNCFGAIVSRGTLLSYAADPSQLLSESFRTLDCAGVAAFDAMNHNQFIKDRERAWREGEAVLDLVPSADGVERKLSRGGYVFAEQKGQDVQYIFFRKYDFDKRQVRERIILEERSPVVKRYLHELSRGLRGPLAVEETPKDLVDWTLTREEQCARYFTPEDLVRMLSDAGFQDISVHPLGHMCEVTILRDLQYPWLSEFIRKNRDSFCLLEKLLSDHLSLMTAWHLFVTARKEPS